MIDAIAAIGDVESPACWSGIPFHCWRAARRLGWTSRACRLDFSALRWHRRWWNLNRALTLRGIGGYQVNEAFLAEAERRVFGAGDPGLVLSFNQHFPRARSIAAAGGRTVYYLDATLSAVLQGHALDLRLPADAARRALAIERDNLDRAQRIVTMARWLRDFLIAAELAPPERISVVLPGANLDVPDAWLPPVPPSRAPGQPWRLGLVGNDWRRKGLPFLIAVARELRRRGVMVQIRVVGRCPPDVDPETTEVIGPIDKGSELSRFVGVVGGCDLGCLFSAREAFGISVLEFLRLGVPVAGFSAEGPADSIPPDAGFAFPPNSSPVAVAGVLEAYFADPLRIAAFRAAASIWSGRVGWERCLRELTSALAGGASDDRVQPWRGLASNAAGAPALIP